MKVSSVFDKLTYWNLETAPNSDDTVVTAMDWPELAEAVSFFIFSPSFFADEIKVRSCLCHCNIYNIFIDAHKINPISMLVVSNSHKVNC